MKSTSMKNLNTLISHTRKVASPAAPAVISVNVPRKLPATKPMSHPAVNRGRLVLMALKINKKYHPEMYQPNGNPRLDVGRFGSL
jgi:hypothetical protein